MGLVGSHVACEGSEHADGEELTPGMKRKLSVELAGKRATPAETGALTELLRMYGRARRWHAHPAADQHSVFVKLREASQCGKCFDPVEGCKTTHRQESKSVLDFCLEQQHVNVPKPRAHGRDTFSAKPQT